MNSREKILASVKKNKPTLTELPEINFPLKDENLLEKFSNIAASSGSLVVPVQSHKEIKAILENKFAIKDKRVFSSVKGLEDIQDGSQDGLPHSFHDLEMAIIESQLAVAENGALWIQDDNLLQRVIPFISQHLSIVVSQEDIVENMHEAYKRIGDAKYGYGVFIGGPSKTADIEQSLVLGAHGARSLTVFVVNTH